MAVFSDLPGTTVKSTWPRFDRNPFVTAPGTNYYELILPYWMILLLTSAAAASPWLRWRFSLRTLLIALTLLALLLGTAFATAHWVEEQECPDEGDDSDCHRDQPASRRPHGSARGSSRQASTLVNGAPPVP